jgi:hypothetical protein
MKRINIILLILAFCLLIGCDNTKSNTGEVEQKSNSDIIERSYLGEIVSIEDGYESQLNSLKIDADDRKSRFIDDVLHLLNNFRDHHADTMIITLANIDAVDPIDTVVTRVYIKNDSVFLKSSWHRNGEILWHDELVNPYLWISKEDEFQYDTRSVWITFTIAIHNAIPTFYNREDYTHISNSFAVEMGYEQVQDYCSKSEYLNYLNSFNGQLLLFGGPESGDRLYVWHEPTKQFATFYMP